MDTDAATRSASPEQLRMVVDGPSRACRATCSTTTACRSCRTPRRSGVSPNRGGPSAPGPGSSSASRATGTTCPGS